MVQYSDQHAGTTLCQSRIFTTNHRDALYPPIRPSPNASPPLQPNNRLQTPIRCLPPRNPLPRRCDRLQGRPSSRSSPHPPRSRHPRPNPRPATFSLVLPNRVTSLEYILAKQHIHNSDIAGCRAAFCKSSRKTRTTMGQQRTSQPPHVGCALR